MTLSLVDINWPSLQPNNTKDSFDPRYMEMHIGDHSSLSKKKINSLSNVVSLVTHRHFESISITNGGSKYAMKTNSLLLTFEHLFSVTGY